jgi:lipopolysaccharide transport system ATP-binding protein
MAKAPGNDKVRLHSVRFISKGVVTSEIEIENELKIELEFWNFKEGAMISSSIHLLDHLGGCIFASGNGNKSNIAFDEWYGQPHPKGQYKTTCVIPANFLNTGRYSINVFVITDTTNLDVIEKNILTFNATESGTFRDDYLGEIIGVIRPRLAWTTQLTQTGMEII